MCERTGRGVNLLGYRHVYSYLSHLRKLEYNLIIEELLMNSEVRLRRERE